MNIESRLVAEAAQAASCDPELAALLLAAVDELRARQERGDRYRAKAMRAAAKARATAQRVLVAQGKVRALLDTPPPRGPRVPREAVIRRWVRMAELRGAGLSLSEIGRRLGVDHTTVLHGLRRLAEVGG